EWVAAGTVLNPAREAVPRVESAADIHLLPIEIDRVATLYPDGRREDHTAVNAHAHAPFAPFGDRGQGVLRIEFKRLPAPAWPAGPLLLALGFDVDGIGPAEPPRHDGRIQAHDATRQPLGRRLDSTFGFQRSGVVVFAIDPATFGDVVEFAPAHDYALSPRLLRVAVNALPVRLRATIALPLYRGNDRHGQTIRIYHGSQVAPDDYGEKRVWRLADTEKAVAVSTAPGGPAWAAGPL